MNRVELLERVRRLGAEFVRRGMHAHAQKLRLYFLAVRGGLVNRRHELDVRWSEELVLDWLKTLRVPPYEAALPSRAPGAPCSRCRSRPEQHPSARTELVFPGGARMRCDGCGAVWLVEEATPPCEG